MAATATEPAPVEAPGLPDYVLNPNATLSDASANWRHGRAPDYTQTRKVYEESMQSQDIVELLQQTFCLYVNAGSDLDDLFVLLTDVS